MTAERQTVSREALLVSARDLASALGATGAAPVLVDCRFNLLKPGAGHATYLAGHIPGAFYADLDRDLSAPREAHTGRHPLPDVDQLRAYFGSCGISDGVRVVAYDEGGGGLAARLWWLLRWMGHRDVVLLDGGYAAWLNEDLAVSQIVPAPRRASFRGAPGHMPVKGLAEVEAGLKEGRNVLLDVRAEERYLGQVEPIDSVAGHVPGALNVPFAGNLDAGQRFLAAGALAARYAPLVGRRAPVDVTCMCGSGVTACHGIFALELAGFPGTSLYPGSWSEWIRSPDRPVVCGKSGQVG